MGIYLNPGNEQFTVFANSELYVDKTMVSPRQIAEYVGFTEREVKDLCEAHDMPFEEMQQWYDGYFLGTAGHVYSPNSVIEAIDSMEFGNYLFPMKKCGVFFCVQLKTMDGMMW